MSNLSDIEWMESLGAGLPKARAYQTNRPDPYREQEVSVLSGVVTLLLFCVGVAAVLVVLFGGWVKL